MAKRSARLVRVGTDPVVVSGDDSNSASNTASTGAAIGAAITHRYHDREEDVVGVNVRDLQDFKSASVEEFWQFLFGQFFCVGGFWLGIERLLTVEQAHKDALFLFCLVAFFAGAIIAFFGYRQLQRRQTRIDKIINSAIRQAKHEKQ